MATFAQNFKITGPIGPQQTLTGTAQAIDATSTVQNYPLGTRVKAVDPVLGGAEFVYLTGVASTVAGDAVTFTGAFATVRDTGTNSKGALAIAMSACVASNYGWYCVKGRCLVNIAGDVTALPAYLVDATAGVVDDAIVATNHVTNASLALGLAAGGSAIVGTTDTTPANKTVVLINDPYVVLAV